MLFAVLLVFFVPSVASVCTFPPQLQGQWGSEFDDWNQLTITSDTIMGMAPEGRALDFSCLSKNGSTYIIESATYEVANLPIALYTCMDIVPSDSSDILYFRVLTNPHRNHRNFSVVSFLVDNQDKNTSEICHKSSTEVPMHFDVFLRKGFESNANIEQCPLSLHAEFSSHFTEDNTTCPEGFVIDGCTNKTYLTFNYTQCNGTGTSYGTPSYMCLTSMTSHNTTYTTIYYKPPASGGAAQPNAYEISCLEQQIMANGTLSITKSAGTCGATPSVGMKANETAECRVMPTSPPPTTTDAGSNNSTQAPNPDSTTSGGSGGQGGGGSGDVSDGDENGASEVISGFATLSVAVILGMLVSALP